MFETIYNYILRAKLYIDRLLLKALMTVMQYKQRLNETETSFTNISSRKLCRITYNRFGNKYNLFMPFNPAKATDMNRFKVYLRNNANEHIDITQQSGIPYLFSAKEMGGNCYLIRDEVSGTNYETEDAPQYLEQYILQMEDD